jgi:HAE1 family hydrophobic/amphiphilic exporter-1
VAEVRDSIKERQGITRLNGEESIGILVRKESGANTVEVTKLAREVMDEIRNENPGIKIMVVSEQAKYIESAISSVLNSIVLGGILAFFVLFIFLQDFKTPVIIAVVIPISIIATFNLLFFRNITLNIMSLGGLALGVGMLVDNSIVVSESIFRHKTLGKPLKEAAYIGTKEVGMAVTASTLTTISVFLPVIYVHGVAGQLFKDQALTVTFALISSLVVSLTLLPMMASWSFGSLRSDEFSKSKENPAAEKKSTKKSKLGFLLWPFKGLKWLIYTLVKGIGKIIKILFSFIPQLFLLLVYYISLPFRPVTKIIFKLYNRAYKKFEEKYLFGV